MIITKKYTQSNKKTHSKTHAKTSTNTKKNKIITNTLPHECKLLEHLRTYLDKTQNDWNYITPS